MNQFYFNNKPNEKDYPEIKHFFDNFNIVKEEYFAYKKLHFDKFRTSDVLEKYNKETPDKKSNTIVKSIILKSNGSFEDPALYSPENIELNKKCFKETIKLTSSNAIAHVVYGDFFSYFDSGYHTDGPEVNLCFFRMSEANKSILKISTPKYNKSVLLKNSGDHYFFYTYTPHRGTVIGPDGIDCCSIAFNV